TLAQNASLALSQVVLNSAEFANLSQTTLLKAGTLNRLIVLGSGSTLAYGKLVHLKDNGSGKITAVLADATDNTKPAHGVVIAPSGIAVGAFGEVMLCTGLTTSISGSTIGTQYYLSTAGNVQSARPSAAGSIIQGVGFGLGSLGFHLSISSLFIQN
ncbi:MAG TPA: hypothetical protein V6C65_10015, partial [Allocoleopsis sp.]